VDSIGLTNVVARLNHGVDLAGEPIGEPTAFCIGVAANADAVDLDEEVRRFEYKVEAGAQFAVMEPVFDLESFDRWLARIAHVRVPLIVRVRTLDGLRDAEFLANEVPGTSMPARLLDRLRRADDEATEGRAIARELALALRSRVQGLQIEASGSGDASLALAEQLVETVR
jgi:homocysteine S-methyltransferase